MWPRLLLILLFAALPTHAQYSANVQNHTLNTLRVDVAFVTGGHVPQGIRVQLLQGLATAVPLAVVVTDSNGSAEFSALLPGDYRVEVSGPGIEPKQSDIIHIQDGQVFISQTIAVRKPTAPNPETNTRMGNTVAVSELDVPKLASKELDRGDAEMQHSNWQKAADHFNKAISIYPQYASAYYNLSVAYSHLDKPDAQREALQNALKINESLAPALVSLAHLDVADHKPEQAKQQLDKVLTTNPTNVEALALRVRVDFMLGQDQQAIDDAQRVHDLPHAGYATVHYTAAAAYQHLNQIPQTIAQLQLLLQEDPNNPRADYIRQTIAELQASSH